MVGNRSLPTEPLPPAPHTSGVVGAHASPSHRPLVFHAGFFFFFWQISPLKEAEHESPPSHSPTAAEQTSPSRCPISPLGPLAGWVQLSSSHPT